ncbi:2772_t:CDS:2, partial [Funneliformis geosporum]
GMANALKMVDENDKETSGGRLGRYLSQKSLKPFLYKGKEPGHYDPIVCYDGEKRIHGYEARRFMDFCKSMIEAKKHIDLSPRQTIIANQCIIALIDEATGYQHEREREELQKQWQKMLGLYVLPEPQPYQKIFPLTIYRQIFRLYNMDFIPENIARPGFIGTLTNKYIYGNLPRGILEKLKKETPKSEKGN